MDSITRLRRAGALVLAPALVLLLAAPASASPGRTPAPEPGVLQVIKSWLAPWLPELGPGEERSTDRASGLGPGAAPSTLETEPTGQDPGGATSQSDPVEDPERGVEIDPAG